MSDSDKFVDTQVDSIQSLRNVQRQVTEAFRPGMRRGVSTGDGYAEHGTATRAAATAASLASRHHRKIQQSDARDELTMRISTSRGSGRRAKGHGRTTAAL